MKRGSVTTVSSGGDDNLGAVYRFGSGTPPAELTSGTHRVPDGLTLEEMRSRYLLLRTARDYSPERLTPRAQNLLVVHAQLALELGLDDEEELYDPSAAPEGLRLLKERLHSDWFSR